MTTMNYYQGLFGNDTGFNVGILVSLILITVLIFFELTQSHVQIQTGTITLLRQLRISLSTVTWILLIIFLGIVFTRITIILAA